MDLLVESDKTPLEEESNKFDFRQFGKSMRDIVFALIEKWSEEMLREDVSTAAENEMSVIICGDMDEEQFLLTGDAGIRALNIAMDYSENIGNTIKENVKIYQIPHHGGRHNLSPSLMNNLIGEIVEENQHIGKTALVSAAKDSDHPLKMVTNAFIRRGVKVYQTNGKSLRHHRNMSDREGWSSAEKIEFSNWVEEWEE